ncbi:MAG: hypothetical protein ACEQSK_05960 [Sphingomonadaceae bacterium]
MRVGGQSSWDGQTLRAPGNAVAVPPGHIITPLLRQRGLQPQEPARSAQHSLLLLGDEASDIASTDQRFCGRFQHAPLP